MKLNSYLKRNHGNASKLAAALGLSPVLVSQWAVGGRPVPITRCPAIERATNGLVTRRDLRPNDWWAIWLELAAAETRQAVNPLPSPHRPPAFPFIPAHDSQALEAAA